MLSSPLELFAASQLTPTFSPDGSQVAFTWNGEQQNNFDIYLKQLGSENLRRLTYDPESEFSPA